MPIEIRELHIKGTVVGANETSGSDSNTDDGSEEEREALIALCVERVMELLARDKER